MYTVSSLNGTVYCRYNVVVNLASLKYGLGFSSLFLGGRASYLRRLSSKLKLWSRIRILGNIRRASGLFYYTGAVPLENRRSK